MSDNIRTCDLFECRVPYMEELFLSCEYPWELVGKIKNFIKSFEKNLPDGFVEIKEGVYAGKNVKIHSSATIEAPAVIGHGTEIRPGAYLRGNVICGSNCTIGNSTEIKNSILLDNVQIPHYNYIGDSVLGNHAHMGAGAVCSNLKSDGSDVVVHGSSDYSTGLRKLGGILADNADVGCGCVLNPGTVVGKNTSVYPLTMLRGVYPPDSIVKSKDVIISRRISI